MTPLTRLLVVFAVAVAMTGSGFAHRVAPADMDESLLAYVAAGGTLDDLCGQGGVGAGGGETCDACRLVDGAAVPTSHATVLSEIDATVVDAPVVASVAPIGQVANPACPVRAPPVV
ncbi:hypothetical protein [Roseobacter sp. CCS2]|uniref:hypothetical protein n=1 Tax=Roseobacter sp. CCS2 TaxID=391593 RepID=UPI0012EAF0AA|nr:hypothetical protein [Roseobacter sp. CCS2]